jgi:high-affinity nickel-transport protein
VETLGLIAEKLNLHGGFWSAVAGLNANFGALGYLIIGIFAASWVVSLLLYHLKGYDRLEPVRGD